MNKLIIFGIGLALGLALNLCPAIADHANLIFAKAIDDLTNRLNTLTGVVTFNARTSDNNFNTLNITF